MASFGLVGRSSYNSEKELLRQEFNEKKKEIKLQKEQAKINRELELATAKANFLNKGEKKKFYQVLLKQEREEAELKYLKQRAEREGMASAGLIRKGGYLQPKMKVMVSEFLQAKSRKPLLKGVQQQFQQIRRSVQTPEMQAYGQPQAWQEKPERPNKLRNFFAHKSEEEVYGDTGLTFFDSEKRADDDTGALFGM